MGKKSRILRERKAGLRKPVRATKQGPISAVVPKGRNKYLPHDGGGQYVGRADAL